MILLLLVIFCFFFFFFKQKTAYEMRISDWSSDVCSSDLDHLDLDQSVGDFLFINSLNSIYDQLNERGIDTRPRANILHEAFYVDITHTTPPLSALVFCRVAVFGS